MSSVPTMSIGMKRSRTWQFLLLALWLVSLLTEPSEARLAYIGPGAGFAFAGSLLTLLWGLAMSVGSLLIWPFRMAWRVVRRRQGFSKASVRRVIFLGLDGLDPRLTEKFLAEGKLPNLAKLRELGSYHRLRTTFPALSPVAWSTFATGVNPGRHDIFDFLNRSLKTYVPELSSARVHPPRRVLNLGRWRIPLSRPWVEARRKSQTFWSLLGKQAIGSTIIRVPITFPPERFNGRMLAAMSTPDLRGTQGSFSHFSTRTERDECEGGARYPLRRNGDWYEGSLAGPPDAEPLPFRVSATRLEIGGEAVDMKPREYTPWVRLRFGGGVYGIVRFLLTESGADFSVYATPVQIDPEHPALPISHPSYYASYLAKLLGTFSTLGMAEDTWALNEGVIGHDDFLTQAYSILAEREAMFRSALEKTPRGVVACVFDTSDRVQHMFFSPEHEQTIEDLYCRMDRLAGTALAHVDPQTVVFVLSDHGFSTFTRGVNLNTWLRENGYLVLKEDAVESGPYFKGVDWSRTRAYTMGLGGLYLNLQGRESGGIVKPGAEAESLRRELVARLTGLRDEEEDRVCIQSVYTAASIYKGPYVLEAPDFIIGYNEGYRTSWDAAVGKVSKLVIEDNHKAWCGDHAVDPHLVPGVLFCNRPVTSTNPGIEDLAPTTLSLFGLTPPAWMDGKPLFTHAK